MMGRPVVEVARFSEDVDALKRFYADLLATSPELDWHGGAIFTAGDVKVLVHERPGAEDDGPPNEDHFAVGVADVNGACRTLRERGAVLLVEPRDYPWGRSAYLRDPDGRLVELLQSY
jgi:predicted enzyme related to lactoylglutathione lyase